MRKLRLREVHLSKVTRLLTKKLRLSSAQLSPNPVRPLTENGEIGLYIHHAWAIKAFSSFSLFVPSLDVGYLNSAEKELTFFKISVTRKPRRKRNHKVAKWLGSEAQI